MIKAKNLNFKYPNGTMALRDIDLEVGKNELMYIIGPSGSGKTTLLKLFMGIEYPSSGVLQVLGTSMNEGQAKKARTLREKIGPVFQEFRLIDGRTAMENVVLGMRFLDISPRDYKEKGHDALEKVGLGHKKFSKVDNLSYGERQRVAIARAVARKPSLILADEPTGNLDKENAINILNLLASFRSDRTSIVITTHATHLINKDEDIKIIGIDKGIIKEERLG